jgi:hypothetical protein
MDRPCSVWLYRSRPIAARHGRPRQEAPEQNHHYREMMLALPWSDVLSRVTIPQNLQASVGQSIALRGRNSLLEVHEARQIADR